MTDNKMLNQEEIDALLKASTIEAPGEIFSGDLTPPEAQADLPGLEEGILTGEGILTDDEKDALGEIGNISMGSAATTLSELLGQKVVITSPTVFVTRQEELFQSFGIPIIIIQVEFKSGLDGLNVLVIKLNDAIVMSNLMMGGDLENLSEEISEIEISAASEAMNQMIGTGSTSLATIFGRTINISPPSTNVIYDASTTDFRLPVGEDVVVISFKMKIGDLLDTEIMQVLSIDTAKREASMLWQGLVGASPPEEAVQPPLPEEEKIVEEEIVEEDDSWLTRDIWPGEQPPEKDEAMPGMQDFPPVAGAQPRVRERAEAMDMGAVKEAGRETAAAGARREFDQPQVRAAGPPIRGQYEQQPKVSGLSFPTLTPVEQRKLELLLDVPLKVSVVLGRTKRPIKEVLNLTPGAIVELNSLVDDPVEILVNGTLVARGEVVVVNENFGVRIVSIISPEERLMQLKE
jgi:flagellar motor switch protein FliN/FliY